MVKNIVDRILKADSAYLLQNGTWVLVSQSVAMMLALFSAYVFANFISPDEYGTYKYILSIFGLCGIATLTGMNTAVVEGVAKKEEGAYTQSVKERIRWGMLGGLFSFAIGFYYLIQDNHNLGIVFLFGLIVVPIFNSITTWQAGLTGRKLFKINAKINIFSQSLITILATLTLFLTRNIYIALVTYIITHLLLHTLVNLYLGRKIKDFFSRGEAKSTIKFGKELSFVKIFAQVVGKLDGLLVWHVFGPIAMAQYAFAQAINAPTNSLLKSLVNLAQPIYIKKKTSDLKTSIAKKTLRSMLITVPFTIVFIVSLPFIYKILFPQYLDSVIYAQALAVPLIFFPLKLYGVGLVTRQIKTPLYITSFVNPLVRLISLAIFVPLLGIWGAIVSFYIDFFFSSLLSFYLFRRS